MYMHYFTFLNIISENIASMKYHDYQALQAPIEHHHLHIPFIENPTCGYLHSLSNANVQIIISCFHKMLDEQR